MWIDAKEEVPEEGKEIVMWREKLGLALGGYLGDFSVRGAGYTGDVTHWMYSGQPAPKLTVVNCCGNCKYRQMTASCDRRGHGVNPFCICDWYEECDEKEEV